jgi:hypothetical protein
VKGKKGMKTVLMKRVEPDDDRGPFRGPFAKALNRIAKAAAERDDDDEDDDDETELIAHVHGEIRRAFEQGRLPEQLGNRENAKKLHEALLRVQLARPALRLNDAFAAAFEELSEDEREGLAEELLAAERERREAARKAELARQARSREAVGSVGTRETVGKEQSMSTMTMYAKMTVDQGRSPGLSRQDFEAAIAKRGAELFPRDTAAKAFTRAMTEDADGRLLYAASKIAPPAVAAAAPAPSALAPAGPAEAELNKKVDEYLAKNVGKSRAQAFAAVYTARENLELKKRYDDEQAKLSAVEKNARAARRAA